MGRERGATGRKGPDAGGRHGGQGHGASGQRMLPRSMEQGTMELPTRRAAVRTAPPRNAGKGGADMPIHSAGRIRLLLATALAAVLWLIAPAPQALAEEADLTPVRIGYYENEIFQKGARPGAPRSGYAYEYCLKIAEYAGWRYKYVYGTFAELYARLMKGEIDLLAGVARTDDRTGRIGFPDRPMGDMPYILAKRRDDFRITADPSSLTGMALGALDGAPASELEAWLERYGASAQIKRFGSLAELYRAFGAGSGKDGIDAFAAMEGGALTRIRAEAVLAFGHADYYLCVAATRPDLLAKLNVAQARLQAEDPLLLGALRMKHYPGTLADATPSSAEKAWLASHRKLRVGCLKNYLPYSDADAKGQVSGMVRDLVAGMLQRLGATGLETSFRAYPSYGDMTAALAKGEIDAAFPVSGSRTGLRRAACASRTPCSSRRRHSSTEATTPA